MAYAAMAKIKKNSPPAALTSGINNSTGTFPVDHLEYFHDADGVLIVDGIVIWDPADPDPTHREEVTITGASGTTGAGNLTGGTRGVNADGTNGAARAFSSGAKIAVQFTTGKMNRIADNFAAHETALGTKASASHTHAESDVTGLTTDLAGKLANTGAAAGKIYVGKTDGTFALVNITQGANITITNADGAVTIASTGGGDFLVQQIFS